jgi:hypothetical protein
MEKSEPEILCQEPSQIAGNLHWNITITQKLRLQDIALYALITGFFGAMGFATLMVCLKIIEEMK